MENRNIGVKELYDINIRLNQPLKISTRNYEINETILSFEKAQLAQIDENKKNFTAKGGFNNNSFVDWEVDKNVSFAITHGVLSPTSYAILSNSKLNKKKSKSVPYKEQLEVVEYDSDWRVLLKYLPNHIDGSWGIQGNPDNEPLPMGRKDWLPLKPLPPQKDKFLFCYDMETGQRIMNFLVCGNQLIFSAEHRKIMVDYTFDYEDNIVELSVGNRLFNGFLNLTGKMTTKDYYSGETKTAVIEIPRLKLNSSISMKLGMSYEDPVVSDFFFTGYPNEGRLPSDSTVWKITMLNNELTGDYI